MTVHNSVPQKVFDQIDLNLRYYQQHKPEYVRLLHAMSAIAVQKGGGFATATAVDACLKKGFKQAQLDDPETFGHLLHWNMCDAKGDTLNPKDLLDASQQVMLKTLNDDWSKVLRPQVTSYITARGFGALASEGLMRAVKKHLVGALMYYMRLPEDRRVGSADKSLQWSFLLDTLTEINKSGKDCDAVIRALHSTAPYDLPALEQELQEFAQNFSPKPSLPAYQIDDISERLVEVGSGNKMILRFKEDFYVSVTGPYQIAVSAAQQGINP